MLPSNKQRRKRTNYHLSSRRKKKKNKKKKRNKKSRHDKNTGSSRRACEPAYKQKLKKGVPPHRALVSSFVRPAGGLIEDGATRGPPGVPSKRPVRDPSTHIEAVNSTDWSWADEWADCGRRRDTPISTCRPFNDSRIFVRQPEPDSFD